MQLAAQVVVAMKDFGGAAAIFVDGVGVGAGVVDRLQMLGHASDRGEWWRDGV